MSTRIGCGVPIRRRGDARSHLRLGSVSGENLLVVCESEMMFLLGGVWIASGLLLQEPAEEKLLPALLRALPTDAFQALPAQAPRPVSQTAASRP